MFNGEYDPDFDETVRAIRQGDVLEFCTAGDGPVVGHASWTAHLAVVITANCDLTHDKHGGLLSIVPVVPLHSYVANLVIPRIGRQLAMAAEKEFTEKLPVAKGWPTAGRLYELLREDESVATIRKFLPTDASPEIINHLQKAEACVRWERRQEGATTWPDVVASFGTLLVQLRELNGHKRKLTTELVENELTNRILKQLPGDALFLDSPAPGRSNGHIAYLRIIREISYEAIVTSAAQEHLKGGQFGARRVGRLSALYLHRLTQQMAAVFTAIGLPEQYESRRNESVLSAIRGWTNHCE